jgi:photosystem II stability/assembly factor-like uncharacterized protein
VVWVGTGENNAQRAVNYGDGVYKSVDGGRSWQNMGLRESEHIGKILIDPRNSDVVYVASQGPLSVKGGERGLYKTTDGGRTWKKVLDGGTWAGRERRGARPARPRHADRHHVAARAPHLRLHRRRPRERRVALDRRRRHVAALAVRPARQRGARPRGPGRLARQPDIVYAILEAATTRAASSARATAA